MYFGIVYISKMIKKALMIAVLIAILISVRIFQYDLFYDPFIAYFKNSYLANEFPEILWGKMTCFLLFRYSINTSVSLTIIYLLFNNKGLLKFSLGIYLVAFIILLPIYYHYIYIEFEGGYLAAFYIRRFLIQPLLLLLLVPAFYYQQMIQDSKN
jgi:exosortase F-associated protein